MQEIERKYLVKNNSFIKDTKKVVDITQGYLSVVPERTVRVRKSQYGCFLTIKGISSDDGLSRYEFEKRISMNEADELLLLCDKKHVLEKTRHYAEYKDNVWEIDVFKGLNIPLTVAEIELKDTNQEFEKPEWVGDEVTGNKDYYNTNILIRRESH